MIINEFKNEHEFLSNFFPTDVVLFGLRFKTAEAAFQAGKAIVSQNKSALDTILSTEPDQAGKAKHIGRNIKMSQNELVYWDEIKVTWMGEVIRCKFFQNQILAALLLRTRPTPLVEGNHWGDVFWGVDLSTGLGENHLGKILMTVRDLLAMYNIIKSRN